MPGDAASIHQLQAPTDDLLHDDGLLLHMSCIVHSLYSSLTVL
jgi:hypothetical protein